MNISHSIHHYRRAVSTVRARVEASAAILFNFAAAFLVSAGAPAFRCSATSCSNRLISLMLSIMWPSPTKGAMVDASCPTSTTRHPPGCSRQKAAKVFYGTSLEVNRERYNAEQIRALYESERYPLTRKDPNCFSISIAVSRSTSHRSLIVSPVRVR